MRIELKDNADFEDENELLALTDDELDNENYIELYFGGKVVCVSLDELLSAVQAFENKRSLRLTRENYEK